MRLLIAVGLCFVPVLAWAQESGKSSNVGPTIQRGLDFLVKDAKAWKEKHNCVSCHHAALIVWSMREARQIGHAVDEPMLAELTKWLANAGDGKTGVARPADKPKALNSKAVWFALALNADPKPDEASQKGLKLFSRTIMEDQVENGSWVSWPETRAPIFGHSDDVATALATLALTPAAAGDGQAKAARDKAVKWLSESKADDELQSLALRLILWKKLGRPGAECESLVRRIKERQKADGGWSQTKEMASDAWATGQALYALAHAEIKPTESCVSKGREFLIKTQREDGSWAMTSRPTKPGGKGATSLIPITGAGSAWAVLGLVRSSGPAVRGK